MFIKRISQLTGRHHTRDIPVEREQLQAWSEGMLIQEAMPQVNANDREFLMTGIIPEEWDDAFGEE